MAYKNKEDEVAAKRRHYLANKPSYIGRNNDRKRAIKEWLLEYKKTIKCAVCPESDPCCLDFHHIDPNYKHKEIAAMHNCGSLQKLRDEIEKCIPLCSNCHRKLHAGVISI